MAAITLDIGANTRQAEKDIQKLVSRSYNINLNTKGDQPLGRITGKVNEFSKSLDASNARVIAFGASAGIIFGLERAFTALVSSTIEVQKSLQDINVILNVSAQNLQKFGAELFGIARNTGQSFQEVAKAATEFSRQGLGVEETLKRTNEALILSRLSGLDTAKSVEALTAAVNSFASQAVTATEIVNKFANVDAAFAVSSADLADAISRVGSSAAQSGVSLNELIAIVTSAQQTTARGGAVIGNSFKTIFTRLQREKVVDLLGSLGISGTDSSGQVKSTIQLLTDLGKVYDTLGSQQQAYVAEQVGGVFQINILKAALADLGKEYSIYGSALNVAAGATDQAIRRNEELNKTYASQINALQENARQLAAAGGERLLGPSIDRLVGGTNTLLSGFNESDGQNVGTVLGKGILDGIGQFIAGPGLALIGGVLLKLFRDLAKFATGSVQQLLGLNTAATQQRDLQTSIQQILSKNPKLLELALKSEQGLNQAANSLLASLQKQTVELQKQAQVASQISKAFVSQAGVRMTGGVPVVPAGRPGKAAGYIPNFASDRLIEKYTAISLGATSSVRPHMSQGTIGGRKFVMNNQEVEFPGVGKNGDSMVIPKYGNGPKIAAAGFIPNFAKTEKFTDFGGKYAYLVPYGVTGGTLPSQKIGKYKVGGIPIKAPSRDKIDAEADQDSLNLYKNIEKSIVEEAFRYTNTIRPLNKGVTLDSIRSRFETTAGAGGALKGAAGAAFEVGIISALDYQSASRRGDKAGNFDIRGGANLKNIQDLFNLNPTVGLADFKVNADPGNVKKFYEKVRKEEAIGAFDPNEQQRNINRDAEIEVARELEKNPKLKKWVVGNREISRKAPDFIRKMVEDRKNIIRPRYDLSGFSKGPIAASGFIPNFAAISEVMGLETAMSGEKAIFDTKPFPHVRNKSQPTFGSAMADHGGKNRALKDSMMGQKRAGLLKSSGFIPNFAIEDPDVQADNLGTSITAITAQLSALAFAFAFSGNQYKDSLKQLTQANTQRAKEELKQARLEAKRLEQRGLGNFATTAREDASKRFREQSTPGIVAKGKAFAGANALGLSIAAPILGETIKNIAGQETATRRGIGETGSAIGQIGSFAATGGLVGGAPGAVIGGAIGALLSIPAAIDAFTSELPDLAAAAKKASQDLTKFSDTSQRILTTSSSLSEFTDKSAPPEKLKKVQDDLAKALSELTPAERSRIESSIRVGNLEEELAKITQERIDQEKSKVEAFALGELAERTLSEKFLSIGGLSDPKTVRGEKEQDTIKNIFRGFFAGENQKDTLKNLQQASTATVGPLESLIREVQQNVRGGESSFGEQLKEAIPFAGNRQIDIRGATDYSQKLQDILEKNIPQADPTNLNAVEARSKQIQRLVDIAAIDFDSFIILVTNLLNTLKRDPKEIEEGIKKAEKASEALKTFNKVKDKYSGIIENSISSLNRTISVFNSLANALDQFQVSAQSFTREQGVAQGFTLPKNVAETVLGPEAELTRRAALFEKIAQNETARLDAIDKSNLSFREEFRGNLNDVFTERLKEIQTLRGADAKTIPEQSALAEEVLRAQKLFESGAVNINDILEDSFKDGAIDSDKFETNLRAAFEKADFKSSETEKILDGILKVSEQQNANLLSINQNAKQQNVRAAQEFKNEKILLDISRSLKVFGGAEGFLQPQEGGIVKPLQTLIQSAAGQLKAQRDFEFGKRAGVLTSFGTESQVKNNIGLGQSSLNFINQLKDISGGAFTPDPGSELYNRAVAGLTQSFQNNIKQLNDVLKDPNVDEAFKSQIKAFLDSIGRLGSGSEISQLQVAQETGAAFQSRLEGTLSRLQDPAIQDLRDAGLNNLADEVARSAQYTSDPIVNVLNVQKSLQTVITKQLENITKLLPRSQPTISISPPITDDVPTNAKGFIPGFNKERQAISRGVGGAKAGDRPEFIPNLNGGPAFVNSGEQLINNFMGSQQTAVLTRDMQNAMSAAKGFIPNFANGQRIVTADEFPKSDGTTKQNLTTEELKQKLEKYQQQYEEAFRFTIPGNEQGTLADAADILRNLQKEFKFNSKNIENIESNPKYKLIKNSVKTLRAKIREANSSVQDRPQDPEFLRFLEEQKNKPRGVGPATAIQDQIAEAFAGSAAGDAIARATAVNPEDLYTDALIRAAGVTAKLGKYTGLNFGTNDALGKANERPKVKIKPQKGGGANSGPFVYGLSEFVEFYSKNPGIDSFFNEATHVNQNLVPGKDVLRELSEAEKFIKDNGGVNQYLQKLKLFADFIEEQNKSAKKQFVNIDRVSTQSNYDTRRFGNIISEEEYSGLNNPAQQTRYIQERSSTLNDALSRGIVSGDINAKELGLLGIPLNVANNIVAETLAIDKQLKEKKPYQPSRPVTPSPAAPKTKPVTPPQAVPGIQPAIQDTTPTITVRKPRKPPTAIAPVAKPETPKVNYPGGISPETARAIVRELDANYNEAIRKSKNPRQAQSWAQTQQRYRLLYSRGQYAELDAFYKSLSKNYQRPIGQNPNKNQNQTNFAQGFIPNFAQDYISNLAGLEAGLSGEDPAMGYDKKIGSFMYNKSQSRSGNLNEIIAKDHPEGLKAAMKNSMKMQKTAGVMNKGFVPNFAVTDQSFTQLESSFNSNTSALTSLAGGIESLNSTLSSFETNFANLNNVTGAQPVAGPQPSVQTTTNAPVNVVVNAQGGTDIATAVGQAVQNAIPTIIEKVRIAMGEKVPPTIRL